MDSDEREIYIYLKPLKDDFVAEREVSRRAGGKNKFQENPGWAVPVLHRMVERNILESDGAGRYRLKPRPAPKGAAAQKKKFVSPQLAKILKDSGKDFSDSIVLENEADMDAYYDSL